MNTPTSQTGPRLPRLLALPLGIIPTAANSTAAATVLNRLFAPQLREGELDFLQDRVMCVRVRDAGLRLCLTLSGGRMRPASERRPQDLTIEGSVYDFLLLASRSEDPDTLFFNRRLKLGGSTELGLYLKNFLDAVEPDARFAPIMGALERAAGLAQRFVERSAPARG